MSPELRRLLCAPVREGNLDKAGGRSRTDVTTRAACCVLWQATPSGWLSGESCLDSLDQPCLPLSGGGVEP